MRSDAPSSPEFTLIGLDDCQDFVAAYGEDSSMSFERFCHVSDLMQKGNKAFRDNRFEEAISCFSRANAIKPGDPVILSNRCATYLRCSQFLKHRPASSSEHKPMTGLDPTIHAELALKDAEKVVNLQSDSVKSYILKANALILLEKYEIARDVVLSGLQVDPMSDPLKSLEGVTARAFGKRGRGKPERSDDFDCTVCLKLLYEPVTTPCGHSFCRSCLFQTMDRGNRCPLCRTILYISPRTCAISVTLKSIIEKSFPEEYAERKLEHDSLTNCGADVMPLFVMDVILPCQKFHLNIFEPRYRLMVRRIMEGNRRMGMVIGDSSGSLAEFACEVEITECEPLPDGRFFLELESQRRFCILRNWEQDGYRVAEVEWVHDPYPKEGSKERADLQELTNHAAGYARSWMRTAREAARQKHDGIRLLELDKAESMMPSTQDPERFSFWLVTLTKRRPSERLELLRMSDTNERIKAAFAYLRAEEQSCRLQ